MPHPRITRRDLDHLRLAAMPVDQRHLAKTAAVKRVEHLGQSRKEGLGAQCHGTGKIDVLVGLAVTERRRALAGDVIGQTRQGMPDHTHQNHRVDRCRQMWPMLLDRTHGDDDKRACTIGHGHKIGARAPGQKAVRRNPGVEHGVSVSSDQIRASTRRSSSSSRSGWPPRTRAAKSSSGTIVVRQ